MQPSYGLTDEQVEGMILDSFDNAEEDFRRRQVIEARNETATILAALEKGKKSAAWGQLTTDEKKADCQDGEVSDCGATRKMIIRRSAKRSTR